MCPFYTTACMPCKQRQLKSHEKTKILTLICNQFPQSLKLPQYIAKNLLLYPKRPKISNFQYNKSARGILPAFNEFMLLFYNKCQFEKFYQLRLKLQFQFMYMKFWTNRYKNKISPKCTKTEHFVPNLFSFFQKFFQQADSADCSADNS